VLLTIHAAPGELSAPPAAQRLDLSTALINALKSVCHEMK
jgi:hypothetical protein